MSVTALSVGAGLGAGYVWLLVLSWRVRSVSRRLALHLCQDPFVVGEQRERVPVEAILRREREASQRMPATAEAPTAPMPAVSAGPDDRYDEECWR